MGAGTERQSGVEPDYGSIGDIGTHAYHLAGYVSGLRLGELAAMGLVERA